MGSTSDEVATTNQGNRFNRETALGNKNLTTDELRSSIAATRSGMDQTVGAIQTKLSPQNVQETAEQITERAKQAALEVTEKAAERLKDTVTQLKNEVKSDIHDATIGRIETMVDNIRETTRGTSASIVDMVKANPIPSALVGIGLAWMFMNKSSTSSSRRSYYAPYERGSGYGSPLNPMRYQNPESPAANVVNTVQEKAGQVVDSVTEAAHTVKDKAEEFVNQAQTQVEHLADRVQDQAQRVAHRSQSMIEDNPLMTSALALTIGAAVGLLLPETQRENELMGETRDKLMSQVSAKAHDTMDKAQKVATEVLHVAGDKAQQEARKQGLTGDQALS